MKQTEILTHATHVSGWEPAVYMSCMSQNFRLFHVSNLSVRNFRIVLLMYTGSLHGAAWTGAPPVWVSWDYPGAAGHTGSPADDTAAPHLHPPPPLLLLHTPRHTPLHRHHPVSEGMPILTWLNAMRCAVVRLASVLRASLWLILTAGSALLGISDSVAVLSIPSQTVIGKPPSSAHWLTGSTRPCGGPSPSPFS